MIRTTRRQLAGLLIGLQLIVLAPFSAVAQENQLRLDVDWARFRASGEYVLLEIYYTLYRHQLQFVRDGQRWRADFAIETTLFAGDSAVVRDELKKVSYADSLEQISPAQHFADVTILLIKPGDYRLVATLQDLHSHSRISVERRLSLAPVDTGKIALSDIELASKISRASTRDRFTKNQLQIIPNSSGIYGTGAPLLYFYAELYNLSTEGTTGRFRVRYAILDAERNLVRVFQEKENPKPGRSSVLASGFNVISLKSGTYYLQIDAEDLDTGESVSGLKRIYIYRPGDFQTTASDSDSNQIEFLVKSPEYRIYDFMNAGELAAEFEAAGYLATNREKEIFASLDSTARRTFLKRFWAERDPDPATAKNEFRVDYLRRLQLANARFGSGKAGWKSDRGRVLLLYGQPDEVERFPSSSENRAYEIWHYYEFQGGVVFIFVDIRGFGDYKLVHSTAREELQDPDWQRWLKPNR